MSHGDDEIRAARAAEADETLRVLCAAFGLPYDAARPIFYGDPFYDLSHKRILRTPRDGIVSCLTLIPLQIRIGRAWVPMAGIAGVATRPEHQGQGHAGRLLAETLTALAEELVSPLAGLFASSASLYRKFGWETATAAGNPFLMSPAAPPPVAAACVRQSPLHDSEDSCAVRRLHAAAAEAKTGALARDDRRWQLIHAVPSRQRALYQRPEEAVSGYAYWENTGEAVRLLEIIGQSPDALQGLAAYVQAQSSLRLDALNTPPMMLRIVDAQRALQSIFQANLAPVLAGSGRALTLRLTDAQRPENGRPLRVTPFGIETGTAADGDVIAMNVSAFAQLYTGYLSPSEAARAGRASASSQSALSLADALFPPRSPFVGLLDQF